MVPETILYPRGSRAQAAGHDSSLQYTKMTPVRNAIGTAEEDTKILKVILQQLKELKHLSILPSPYSFQ